MGGLLAATIDPSVFSCASYSLFAYDKDENYSSYVQNAYELFLGTYSLSSSSDNDCLGWKQMAMSSSSGEHCQSTFYCSSDSTVSHLSSRTAMFLLFSEYYCRITLAFRIGSSIMPRRPMLERELHLMGISDRLIVPLMLQGMRMPF